MSKPPSNDDEVGVRRSEFLADLQRQMELARGGQLASPTKRWWTAVDGVLLLRLRFRGKVLQVQGGCDTALLYSRRELIDVLSRLVVDVEAGRLDQALQAVAGCRPLVNSNEPCAGSKCLEG